MIHRRLRMVIFWLPGRYLPLLIVARDSFCVFCFAPDPVRFVAQLDFFFYVHIHIN